MFSKRKIIKNNAVLLQASITALIYFIFTTLCLLLTNRLIPELNIINRIQKYKDLSIILISGVIIFGLVFKIFTRYENTRLLLEESRKYFHAIYENVLTGIAITDWDGYFKHCNSAYCKLFGYSQEELIQLSFLSLISPDEREYIKLEIQRLKNGEQSFFETENRYIHKDGHEIRIYKYVSTLPDKTGKPALLLKIITNASARKQTEEKLWEQKLLNAEIHAEERERKRIAQELHDGIGPLLSTTKLYIQTYIKAPKKALKQSIKSQILGTLDDAIDQISLISNNLSPHILNDFGLKVAIQRTLDKIALVTGLKITHQFNIKHSLTKEYEITLYRISMELINNTVKHANASLIIIGFDSNDDYVSLHFKNDGLPFDFNTLKKQNKGMGLLNIENRIHSFGGNLDFISNEKTGIEYHIRLPL